MSTASNERKKACFMLLCPTKVKEDKARRIKKKDYSPVESMFGVPYPHDARIKCHHKIGLPRISGAQTAGQRKRFVVCQKLPKCVYNVKRRNRIDAQQFAKLKPVMREVLA